MTDQTETKIKSPGEKARRSRYLKRSTKKGIAFHEEFISKDFPEVFGDWKQPKPLAIGSAQQLKEHYAGKCPSMAIQCFLGKWVSTFAYKKALIKGNLRYNIDGSKSELIDDVAKEQTQTELEKMKKKAKQREAMQKKRLEQRKSDKK